jgi:hypothetical protein
MGKNAVIGPRVSTFAAATIPRLSLLVGAGPTSGSFLVPAGEALPTVGGGKSLT